ncbi:ribose 5-phosphate isomerase B [Flavobacteriaceae bacterium]|jgi:ribose 5-phosphate isomerase B|nr:ribose 5-phosphate isomerase B [Flavobacteriaceae bacterium]MBT5493132.1 ribose 5-phosphate isomerase B [Flavobacteriaceae bacterium]MDA8807558.1 ribose 5-phosphate isomerase B [Flavobacteriaceae bacterium]
MKIAIGNDHAGTEYKKEIQKMLLEDNHVINNHGTDDDKSVDYPDHIHPVASQVENNEVDFGIIICGSGNGANMTANKHQKIRSALCWNKEIATLSRTHNNANILSIPSRFVSLKEAKEMVNSFLNTSFEGGRHQTRVNKIPK